MKLHRFFIYAASALSFLFVSCEDNSKPEDPGKTDEQEISKEAKIKSFKLVSGNVSIDGKVYEDDKVVEIVYLNEQYAALAAAKAEVTVSDKATITPDPSEEKDYTADTPVKYTVLAEDGKTSQVYSVELVEATVSVRCEPVWKKTFGDLSLGNYTMGDCGVAFSGLNIVTFDWQVFDLEGKKIGTVNKEGLPNDKLICMSNDMYGVLVASVGVTKDGGVPENGDAIHHGAIYAWLDGWDKAPVKMYENTEGAVVRYLSVGGDIKNGNFILNVISPGRGAKQMFHCFAGSKADFKGWKWSAFNVNYPTNDGNWSQIVSPATGDVNGKFFIGDSRSNNAGYIAYARQGVTGEDVALNGTLWDDSVVAEQDHAGKNQYGNYSTGHVRGFNYNGVDYVAVSSSGWAAGYFTVQPADSNGDYLVRSTKFNVATPFPASAYVFDPATGDGHLVFMAANTDIARYDITRVIL